MGENGPENNVDGVCSCQTYVILLVVIVVGAVVAFAFLLYKYFSLKRSPQEDLENQRFHAKSAQSENSTLKDENKRLTKENTTLKDENKRLTKEDTTLKDENKRLNKENTTLQDENNRLNKENVQIRDQNNGSAVENTRLAGENATLKYENNRLNKENTQQENENKRLNKELADQSTKYQTLLNSVGKDLSRSIGKDETKTEDINRKWRPTTIKESYSNLSFQTASTLKLQIKEELDKKDGISTEFVDRVFCNIYLKAEETCRQIYAGIMESLQNPLSKRHGCESMKTLEMQSGQGLQNIFDQASVFLRGQTDVLPTSEFEKGVAESAFHAASQTMSETGRDVTSVSAEIQEYIKSQYNSEWEKYVSDVCQLVWYMTIQRPAMSFTTPGIGCLPNEDLHKMLPYRGMEEDQAVVNYYLEPTLKHGASILEKGRVKMTAKRIEDTVM